MLMTMHVTMGKPKEKLPRSIKMSPGSRNPLPYQSSPPITASTTPAITSILPISCMREKSGGFPLRASSQARYFRRGSSETPFSE